MSCAKTAEPIEMQFGMLSRVGPGNHELYEGADAPTKRGTFGMSGRLKSIVKHGILGVGGKASCANGWTEFNNL